MGAFLTKTPNWLRLCILLFRRNHWIVPVTAISFPKASKDISTFLVVGKNAVDTSKPRLDILCTTPIFPQTRAN